MRFLWRCRLLALMFPGIQSGQASYIIFHASTKMNRPNRIMPGHNIFSGRLWISRKWNPSLTSSSAGTRWMLTVHFPIVSSAGLLLKKVPETLSISRIVDPQDLHLGGIAAAGVCCDVVSFVLLFPVCGPASGAPRGAGGGMGSVLRLDVAGFCGEPRLAPGHAIHLPLPSWSSSSLSLCHMSGGMGLPPMRVPSPGNGGVSGFSACASCRAAVFWPSRSPESSRGRPPASSSMRVPR